MNEYDKKELEKERGCMNPFVMLLLAIGLALWLLGLRWLITT